MPFKKNIIKTITLDVKKRTTANSNSLSCPIQETSTSHYLREGTHGEAGEVGGGVESGSIAGGGEALSETLGGDVGRDLDALLGLDGSFHEGKGKSCIKMPSTTHTHNERNKHSSQ